MEQRQYCKYARRLFASQSILERDQYTCAAVSMNQSRAERATDNPNYKSSEPDIPDDSKTPDYNPNEEYLDRYYDNEG